MRVKVYSLTHGPHVTHASSLLHLHFREEKEAQMQDIGTGWSSPDHLVCNLMGLTDGKWRPRDRKGPAQGHMRWGWARTVGSVA